MFLPHVEVGTATDVGRVREGNEDALLAIAPGGAEGGATLVAVADGMGGHNAGEVASALAVQTLAEALGGADARSDPGGLLARAIGRANQTVWEAARADPAREGMGTTLVCALVGADGGLVVANIGDSRAYTVSEQRARLVTVDHTWVTEQVRSGRMSEREAQVSPYRNLLTRALGSAPEVAVDLYDGLRLAPGEALVLCSDGVTTYVEPGDLLEVLREARSAQQAAEQLVGRAVSRGGADNATAVVVRMRS